MKVTAEVDAGEDAFSSQVERLAEDWKKAAQTALLASAVQIAASIQSKGRADIGAAGNFGGRWTEGFQAVATGGGDEVVIDVTENQPYWQVFQFGATIVGKPLLYFKPTKAVGGLAGREGNMPLVISKHSVTIPKKFHLIETAQSEADAMPLLFGQAIQEAKANMSKE